MLYVFRRSWRQLTSMRTALILLFLLAVAAIPGSLLPQRTVAVEKVNQYLATHGDTGRWLDRLWLFDVYSSPWFSAIYLLLFVSLVGCFVPRLRDHTVALFRRPPEAPQRLERLPAHASLPGPVPAADVAGALRARRFRVAVRADGEVTTVSAEKGQLKESGNLLFHLALLALLIGVGAGSWWGWHANRLLVAGEDQAFCNTLGQYDEYGLGARVTPGGLPPFCLQLDRFDASYVDSGQPVSFAAAMRYSVDGAPQRSQTVKVNSPLRLSGADVYLPTAATDGSARSAFPAERDPRLVLVAYVGDLGAPPSVYSLDQRQIQAGRLAAVGEPHRMRAGEKWTLPDGSTVEFLGTRPWVTLSVRHDPGEKPVLAAAVLLLLGLLVSLTGKRRRVWFRLSPDGVVAGGLPRTEYPGFRAEFDEIVRAVRERIPDGCPV